MSFCFCLTQKRTCSTRYSLVMKNGFMEIINEDNYGEIQESLQYLNNVYMYLVRFKKEFFIMNYWKIETNTSVSLLEWCIGRENAFSSKKIKFNFAAWWHLSCDAANDHKPAEFFHKQCILQLCHLPTITCFVLCYTNLSAQQLHQVQDIKEVETNIVCLMMKKTFGRKENEGILIFKKSIFLKLP